MFNDKVRLSYKGKQMTCTKVNIPLCIIWRGQHGRGRGLQRSTNRWRSTKSKLKFQTQQLGPAYAAQQTLGDVDKCKLYINDQKLISLHPMQLLSTKFLINELDKFVRRFMPIFCISASASSWVVKTKFLSNVHWSCYNPILDKLTNSYNEIRDTHVLPSWQLDTQVLQWPPCWTPVSCLLPQRPLERAFLRHAPCTATPVHPYFSMSCCGHTRSRVRGSGDHVPGAF